MGVIPRASRHSIAGTPLLLRFSHRLLPSVVWLRLLDHRGRTTGPRPPLFEPASGKVITSQEKICKANACLPSLVAILRRPLGLGLKLVCLGVQVHLVQQCRRLCLRRYIGGPQLVEELVHKVVVVVVSNGWRRRVPALRPSLVFLAGHLRREGVGSERRMWSASKRINGPLKLVHRPSR